MSYLLDTNIVSEINKNARCHPSVQRWYSATDEKLLWLSVVVIAEIRKGIERVRPHDPSQAEALEKWLGDTEISFFGKILPVDEGIAHRWGFLNARNTLPYHDSFLAATAIEHRLTLVTKNTEDIKNTGVSYLNPFEL